MATNTCSGRLLFRNSREQKNTCLTTAVCCWTSLAFDSCLLLFLFWPARGFHTKLQIFLEEGGYHFACLFHLLSLSYFLHTESKPSGCITQKADVFRIKNLLSKPTIFCSCVTLTMINVHPVSFSGCTLFPPLLQVI